jgi:hypothetical protein
MANTAFFTHSFADNIRFAKSKLLSSPDDGTYNVIRIPKRAFITDVWLHVDTVADVVPATCTVGWLGNGETAVTNGFITTDVADALTTGLKRAQKDTVTTFEGKYFTTAGGAITFTYEAGTGVTTKGVFQVFALYIVIF